MTGQDDAAAAEKRGKMTEAKYLETTRAFYYGPEPDPDPNPKCEAVVALCDLLMKCSTPTLNGGWMQCDKAAKAYLAELHEARNLVNELYRDGQRSELARLLSIAGTKISHLNRRLECHTRAQQAKAPFPLHGGTRADTTAIPKVSNVPPLGLPGEWRRPEDEARMHT